MPEPRRQHSTNRAGSAPRARRTTTQQGGAPRRRQPQNRGEGRRQRASSALAKPRDTAQTRAGEAAGRRRGGGGTLSKSEELCCFSFVLSDMFLSVSRRGDAPLILTERHPQPPPRETARRRASHGTPAPGCRERTPVRVPPGANHNNTKPVPPGRVVPLPRAGGSGAAARRNTPQTKHGGAVAHATRSGARRCFGLRADAPPTSGAVSGRHPGAGAGPVTSGGARSRDANSAPKSDFPTKIVHGSTGCSFKMCNFQQAARSSEKLNFVLFFG